MFNPQGCGNSRRALMSTLGAFALATVGLQAQAQSPDAHEGVYNGEVGRIINENCVVCHRATASASTSGGLSIAVSQLETDPRSFHVPAGPPAPVVEPALERSVSPLRLRVCRARAGSRCCWFTWRARANRGGTVF